MSSVSSVVPILFEDAQWWDGLGLYFIGFSGKACCLSTPAESRGREVMVLAIVMEVTAFGITLLLALMLLLFPITFVGFLMIVPLVMMAIVVVRYFTLIIGLRSEL